MKTFLPVSLLSAMLVLASCRCASTKMQLAPAPVVVFDGGEDMSLKACKTLNAAGCPAGADVDACAAALRNDNAQGVGAMAGSGQNLACIVDAGASPAALKACNVTCD
jgi:hypothetical protein